MIVAEYSLSGPTQNRMEWNAPPDPRGSQLRPVARSLSTCRGTPMSSTKAVSLALEGVLTRSLLCGAARLR